MLLASFPMQNRLGLKLYKLELAQIVDPKKEKSD